MLAVESCGTTRSMDPTLDTALRAIAADCFGVSVDEPKCPRDLTERSDQKLGDSTDTAIAR